MMEDGGSDAGKSWLSEDDVKHTLQLYLSQADWKCSIKWGHELGTDIDARKGTSRWIIEAKGQGSTDVLGEILRRMTDPQAKYSIALPDIQQFRRLWDRLPKHAKNRTGITVLFVSVDGKVTEIS